MSSSDIGRLLLRDGETITKRLHRMREPERTELFARAYKRVKEVSDLLGPSASTDDKMVEIYFAGVHDGSEMQKRSPKT